MTSRFKELCKTNIQFHQVYLSARGLSPNSQLGRGKKEHASVRLLWLLTTACCSGQWDCHQGTLVSCLDRLSRWRQPRPAASEPDGLGFKLGACNQLSSRAICLMLLRLPDPTVGAKSAQSSSLVHQEHRSRFPVRPIPS